MIIFLQLKTLNDREKKIHEGDYDAEKTVSATEPGVIFVWRFAPGEPPTQLRKADLGT